MHTSCCFWFHSAVATYFLIFLHWSKPFVYSLTAHFKEPYWCICLTWKGNKYEEACKRCDVIEIAKCERKATIISLTSGQQSSHEIGLLNRILQCTSTSWCRPSWSSLIFLFRVATTLVICIWSLPYTPVASYLIAEEVLKCGVMMSIRVLVTYVFLENGHNVSKETIQNLRICTKTNISHLLFYIS